MGTQNQGNDNPAPSDDALRETIERQERALDLQLQWIGAVDTKTPIIIGIATAMLAALAAIAPSRCEMTWLDGALLFLGGAPLLGCLFCCMNATRPNLKGPDQSMIFCGGIVKVPQDQYASKVNARSKQEHLDDLSAQVYTNARIANAKFKSVQWATIWLLVGTLLWLGAGYFLYKG